jgi:hypothetical protein
VRTPNQITCESKAKENDEEEECEGYQIAGSLSKSGPEHWETTIHSKKLEHLDETNQNDLWKWSEKRRMWRWRGRRTTTTTRSDRRGK